MRKCLSKKDLQEISDTTGIPFGSPVNGLCAEDALVLMGHLRRQADEILGLRRINEGLRCENSRLTLRLSPEPEEY